MQCWHAGARTQKSCRWVEGGACRTLRPHRRWQTSWANRFNSVYLVGEARPAWPSFSLIGYEPAIPTMHASASWSASRVPWLRRSRAVFASLQGPPATAPSPKTPMIMNTSDSMFHNRSGYRRTAAIQRIDKVRSTLAKILPQVTRSRATNLSHTVQALGTNATYISIPRRPSMLPTHYDGGDALTPAGRRR